MLAVLSNADLQLSTLARQTEVEQQLNNMRSQELAQQTRSANRRELNQALTDLSKAQRPTTCSAHWPKRASSAPRRSATRGTIWPQRNRMAILKRSIAEDEALQANQLGQLRASTSSLNQSLSIARSSLSQLQPAPRFPVN